MKKKKILKKTGILWSMGTVWHLNLSMVKFYWKRASLIRLHIVCGCCNMSVTNAADKVWSAKLKIPATCSFTTRLPTPKFGDVLICGQRRLRGEFCPPLRWNEEGSECGVALDADVGVMATFWNSFPSTSPNPDFPSLPHSLLPGPSKVNSKALAKDHRNQPAVLCRPERVTSKILRHSNPSPCNMHTAIPLCCTHSII